MMSKSLHLVDRAITCRVGAGAQRVPPGGEREVDRQCDVGSADSAPPARDKRHREHQRAAVHAGFENLCHDLVYDGATEPHGYTIYPCPSKAKSRGAPPPHHHHARTRSTEAIEVLHEWSLGNLFGRHHMRVRGEREERESVSRWPYQACQQTQCPRGWLQRVHRRGRRWRHRHRRGGG